MASKSAAGEGEDNYDEHGREEGGVSEPDEGDEASNDTERDEGETEEEDDEDMKMR